MAEQNQPPPDYLTRAEMKDIIQEVSGETVKQTLMGLGIASDDPIKMQGNMQFLSDLKTMNDSVKKISRTALVGLLVTATLSLLAMGFRTWFMKKQVTGQ